MLKRRALEITDLEEKILDEFSNSESAVEGIVSIGCGEFTAVEILAKICEGYKKKYPLVQIALHTGTADVIYEMMNKGLVDIGVFLEPVEDLTTSGCRTVTNGLWQCARTIRLPLRNISGKRSW